MPNFAKGSVWTNQKRVCARHICVLRMHQYLLPLILARNDACRPSSLLGEGPTFDRAGSRCLQSVDLTFRLAIAPGQVDGVTDRVDIAGKTARKTRPE